MRSVVRYKDKYTAGTDMEYTQKTHDKKGLTDEDIFMPSHFFGRKSIGRSSTSNQMPMKKK